MREVVKLRESLSVYNQDFSVQTISALYTTIGAISTRADAVHQQHTTFIDIVAHLSPRDNTALQQNLGAIVGLSGSP